MKPPGKMETFSTGAKRDSQDGKLRYDLIPPAALTRMAALYTEGAKHYGEWEWTRGMPFTRFIASMWRHFMKVVTGAGSEEEDHLAQLVFGAFSMMHFQEEGRLDLDDRREDPLNNLTSLPEEAMKQERAQWESVPHCAHCGYQASRIWYNSWKDVRGTICPQPSCLKEYFDRGHC